MRHILVAVDFSDPCKRAAELAAMLQDRLGCKVTAVHVHDSALDVHKGVLSRLMGPSAEAPAAAPEMLRELSEELETFVQEVFGAHAAGVARRVDLGRPVDVLNQVASEVGADTVVVGTTGRAGVEKMLLGSCAESLVRKSPVPVLTVH